MCVCVLMNEVYACFTFAMQIRRMLMGVSCCEAMDACAGVCVLGLVQGACSR